MARETVENKNLGFDDVLKKGSHRYEIVLSVSLFRCIVLSRKSPVQIMLDVTHEIWGG